MLASKIISSCKCAVLKKMCDREIRKKKITLRRGYGTNKINLKLKRHIWNHVLRFKLKWSMRNVLNILITSKSTTALAFNPHMDILQFHEQHAQVHSVDVANAGSLRFSYDMLRLEQTVSICARGWSGAIFL